MDTKQALRRMKNGASVHRLTIGELPDVMRRQLATSRRYRRELEQLVAEVKGEVSVIDAHYVDEAVGAETHAALCRWLLRERLQSMTTADIVICSKEILKSKGVRNRAVEQLALDRVQADAIDALYHIKGDATPTPDATPDQSPASDTFGDSDAAGANPCVQGGNHHDNA